MSNHYYPYILFDLLAGVMRADFSEYAVLTYSLGQIGLLSRCWPLYNRQYCNLTPAKHWVSRKREVQLRQRQRKMILFTTLTYILKAGADRKKRTGRKIVLNWESAQNRQNFADADADTDPLIWILPMPVPMPNLWFGFYRCRYRCRCL